MRLNNLTDYRLSLSFYETVFNKNYRLTLWYIAGKRHGYRGAIHYAFFKVYHFWGMDILDEKEAEGF